MSKKLLPKHEFTVMLDDIREEKGGKFTLIGLYSKDIIVDFIPTTIAKFCFFTRLLGGEGQFNFKFSLKDPDGNEMLTKFSPFQINTSAESHSNLNLTISPFTIKKEGNYKFAMLLDDKPFYDLTLGIKKGQSQS